MGPSHGARENNVKGLRFERIGENRYYNVVFHMGSSYVPVSDETLEELKAKSSPSRTVSTS